MTYQGCTFLFKREQGGGGGGGGGGGVDSGGGGGVGGGGGGCAQIKLCEWQLLPLASKRESRFSIWRNSNNTLCSTK